MRASYLNSLNKSVCKLSCVQVIVNSVNKSVQVIVNGLEGSVQVTMNSLDASVCLNYSQ